MSILLTIPNEIMDEIASYLGAKSTLNLLITCRCISSQILRFLLAHAAAPEVDDMPALHWATLHGHFQLVQFLIAHGADVRGDAAYVPMFNAISGHSPTITRLLLNAGASPNATDTQGVPLIVAAASTPRNTAIVEMLLEYGANIDESTASGNTALLTAVMSGLLATVKVLVDRGADINLADSNGISAFHEAALSKKPDIAVYLAGCEGLDIYRTNGFNDVVHRAVMSGNATALRILLRRGAVTNLLDHVGRTVLDSAVSRGEETVLRTLLEQGAFDPHDFSGLRAAVNDNSLPFLAILLEYWPDWTKTGKDRFQLFMLPCMRRWKPMVELMLEKGMDVNVQDENGMTVMAHAKLNGFAEVVQMMASYGGQ